MTLGFEFFDAAGNPVADGVFIPVAALPGVSAAELAAGEPAATKEAKVLLAMLNQFFNVLSPAAFNKLGFAVTKSAPAGIIADVFNQTFSATWQKLVNLDDNTVSMIPEPGTGANTGLGSFSILDVFPGSAKVAAGAVGGATGAGVVIQTVSLTPYGSLTHAALAIAAGSDNRDWFSALLDHLALDAVIRTASIASAVTAATASAVGAIAIPAAFTATPDPTSGILAADLPKRGIITRTLTYTVQLLVNQTTQAFDVRVVTA